MSPINFMEYVYCFNMHRVQWYSPDKNQFIEILNLCTETGGMQYGYFCLENQRKSVLMVFMSIFKTSGKIFKIT